MCICECVCFSNINLCKNKKKKTKKKKIKKKKKQYMGYTLIFRLVTSFMNGMIGCYLRCWCCECTKITQCIVKCLIFTRSWKLSQFLKIFRLLTLLILELVFMWDNHFYTKFDTWNGTCETEESILWLSAFALFATMFELCLHCLRFRSKWKRFKVSLIFLFFFCKFLCDLTLSKHMRGVLKLLPKHWKLKKNKHTKKKKRIK